MNTEHTNQPKQAAEAAFEQWWQRHGLEDPMDDEDRHYITASSWARRGYLAAMQTQQAEATLCASCTRANVDCPIYPQQTASCVEHRPAAQQQAEPVARDVLMALARDVERELISGGYVAFSEQELASIVDRHAARLPVEMHSTDLNDRKAAEIIQTQGFTATGYVLAGQDGRYALCNGGAVRWLDKAEYQHIMFPGVEHSPVPVPSRPNQYGLDTPYFARWLNRVIPRLDYYRPDDFARELGRMAAAADKTALLQDQLSGAVAQKGTDQ